MAGAGVVILFVVSLVGLTIFSLIYLTCASHYFLTTITESSTGVDEVTYPREAIVEWWWKPLFVLWVLGFWIIPLAAVSAPLVSYSPVAAGIVFVALLWLLFPLSLTSALVTQNWFFFLHPVVAWRMLRHFGAFAYVHLLTLAAAAACVGFLFAAITQNFLWAIPAAFAIPTTILFYARNWGRFAWLALNFVPRINKPATEAKKASSDTDTVPEMDVQEIDPAAEGIREGLPGSNKGGIKIVTSPAPSAQGVAAPTPYQVDNDETNMETKPYLMVEDPTKPNFQEDNDPPTVPLAPAATQATGAPPVQEEDEWATEKKPYGVIGDMDFKSPPPSPTDDVARTDADRPISVSKHYDDQHERTKEKKRKTQADDGMLNLLPQSKKTPTFADAMFFGVWRFMVYERTLTAWFGLFILTAVELFFIYMCRMTFRAD